MFGVAAMRTNDELIEEELRADAAFRAEWKRAALGRAVAIAIVRYRAAHDLPERDLAERLGTTLPQIERLEAGDFNPSRDTVARVSSQLGIELTTIGGR
jgi:ribosome-binding protein aMBF1 (putative translation factor)